MESWPYWCCQAKVLSRLTSSLPTAKCDCMIRMLLWPGTIIDSTTRSSRQTSSIKMWCGTIKHLTMSSSPWKNQTTQRWNILLLGTWSQDGWCRWRTVQAKELNNKKQARVLTVSWTTIVVHSRDDEEVGVAHKVTSPENQPQFSQTMMMGQYWLSKTKPKPAFWSTRNAFKKLPWNFKRTLLNGIFYWLTN